jgi:arginyl-tRNA--protein-N-Asp/Glu arginylyltransferase
VTEHSTNIPQFYLTAPTPCSYLPGRQERKVFTHLVGEDAPHMNDVLTQGGFRRSQTVSYRPACDKCQACIPVRICVNDFRLGKTFKRIWTANSDLRGVMDEAIATSEHYSLFRHYIDTRHSDGGMVNMSVQDYTMMVEETHVNTMLVEYRRLADSSGSQSNTQLLGVALTDMLSDGLSMVYSFFEPDEAARSLGTYMVLEHIERARKMGLPYVYLGYWVSGSPKMDYKRRFTPQERLTPRGWELVV